MALRVTCPSCRSSYFVDDEVRGKRIICADCKKPMIVPATNAPPNRGKDDVPSRSAGRSGVQKAATRSGERPAPTVRRLRDHDVDLTPAAGNGPKADDPETNAAWYLVGGLGALGVIVVGLIGILWALGGSRPAEETRPALVARPSPQRARGEIPPAADPPAGKNPPEAAGKEPSPKENPGAEASAALTAKDRERVKRATAYIEVHMPGGGVSQGSGFFAVSPGIVLTNAHVLGMLKADSRLPQRVQVTCHNGEANERAYPAKVLGVDRSSDLAVLRVPEEDGLPEPLEVKSAKNLSELQKVYVFGFPFGDRLGKNITISESSVSSLRKEPGTNIIQKVQVNGGMQPGNSGGPVVDAQGDVIGVAVSGIRDTQINFAVPGDFVKSILNGRVDNMTIAQPYLDNGEVKAEVKLQVLDPLCQVRFVGVEYWTGFGGPTRPPSTTQPRILPGDSPPEKAELRYDGSGNAAGAITLPPLPNSKVYWIRPVITDGAGQTTWTGAGPYTPLPPMERKPATLVLKARQGVRPIHLTSTTTLKVVDDREDHAIAVNVDVNLHEQTVPAGPGGYFINLAYSNARMGITIDGRPAPKSAQIQQSVSGLMLVVAQLVMDRNGNVKNNGVVAPRLHPNMRKQVLEIHEIINEALEVVAVPLPNKKVEAGQTWTALRPVTVVTGDKSDLAMLELTMTYLGTRTRDGKQEAVIDIAGKMKGAGNQVLRYGGTANGLALYDLAAGQIAQSRLTVRFDMDEASARGVRAVGTLEVRLERP